MVVIDFKNIDPVGSPEGSLVQVAVFCKLYCRSYEEGLVNIEFPLI